jgi:hypothetical protein
MGSRFLISRINHHGRIKTVVTAHLCRAPRATFSRGAYGTADYLALPSSRTSEAWA